MKRLVLVLVLVLGCRKGDTKPDAGSLQATLASAKVPGIAIAVVRDGILARTESAGNVTSETPMDAASIAKTIVGIAVMELVEVSLLDLDEDVSSYLKFPLRHPKHPTIPISLRMLLTHTSGIHDRADLEEATDPVLDKFLRGYVKAPDAFDAEPGTRVDYSNVGASFAALCVEKKTGEHFGSWARRSILEPFGMKATYRPVHAVYPAVDLYATAGDLGKLLVRMIIGGGPLLDASTVETMLDGRLGWQAIHIAGREVLGHEGEDRTASTAMFFDRKTKNGAVILTNGDAFASGDPARAKALQDLLADLLK